MGPSRQEPSRTTVARPDAAEGTAAAAAAVAMIALAPLGTALLPSRPGLLTEAGPTAGILVLAWLCGRPAAGWREMAPSTKWGLRLYTAAALWGTVVGIVSGHPLGRVAGQALAMLLLVAAAFVFSRLAGFRGEALVAGLGVASGVLLLLRGVTVLRPLPLTARLEELDAFAGGGVLAALVGSAYLLRRRTPLTLAAAFATVLVALGRFGDGAWTVLGVGLAVLCALALSRRRLTVGAAAAVALCVLAAAVVVRSPLSPRPAAPGAGPAPASFPWEPEDAEWRVAYEQWLWASPARRLVGQGLGAVESLAGPSADARPLTGAVRNVYLFLAYQLGLAGLAALTGLLLLVFASFASPGDSHRGWWWCAAGSVWVAHLLWSVTSAEILDLRIAPLLGAMVALVGRNPGAARADRPLGRPVLPAVLTAPLILAVAIPWWRGGPSHAVARTGLPNVVLLSIDTLRADHLGCYGYPRETSPVLDRLAGESLLYTNTQAPTPWTLPSHAGMLTGIHPFDLGIRGRTATLPEETPMLAEHLRRLGYRSAAFVDSTPDSYLGVRRGFGRGFDLYRHAPHVRNPLFLYDMAATVDVAARWLRRRDSARPFFLFLHTKSVHSVPDDSPDRPPYDQPSAYRGRFRPPDALPLSWKTPGGKGGSRYLSELNERLRAGELRREGFPAERREALMDQYDAGIYYVDAQIGRFLDLLESLALRESTVLIVTSDHGEAFLEHRQFLHAELYRPLLHVPLIVRLPGRRQGGVIHRLTTLTDIVPTVLELVGTPLPENFSGQPLPREDLTDSAPRTLFAYLGLSQARQDHQAYALHGAGWKLVYHDFAIPGEFVAELYDPRTDPAEQRPIEGRDEEVLAYLQALRTRLRQAPTHEVEEIRVDEETRRLLRALGYL